MKKILWFICGLFGLAVFIYSKLFLTSQIANVTVNQLKDSVIDYGIGKLAATSNLESYLTYISVTIIIIGILGFFFTSRNKKVVTENK